MNNIQCWYEYCEYCQDVQCIVHSVEMNSVGNITPPKFQVSTLIYEHKIVFYLCSNGPHNVVALFQGQWNRPTWLNNAMLSTKSNPTRILHKLLRDRNQQFNPSLEDIFEPRACYIDCLVLKSAEDQLSKFGGILGPPLLIQVLQLLIKKGNHISPTYYKGVLCFDNK